MIRNRDNKPVHVNVDMEGLLDKVMHQNFVPVVDDDKVFIGIVTRKDVIQYLMDELKKKKKDGLPGKNPDYGACGKLKNR